MAIQISGINVIDNSRNVVNVVGVGSTGTSVFYGDGSNLTGITGGSGDFNTGITSTVQMSPLSYDTTVFTFPSTASREYIIQSINVSNVTTEEINIIAALNFNSTGRRVHLAYNVPIPAGGSAELLKQPHIANPSDSITMWSTDSTYAGRSSALEVYMNYTTSTDVNYFGVGISTVSVGTTALTGIFTSTSSPSMIESIHLVNRTDDGDYPISIQVTNGASTSYLARNLVIPRYATVEICDMPKRIETNGVIRVGLGQTNTIDVSISGKTITG
jgi:hypothetical protein